MTEPQSQKVQSRLASTSITIGYVVAIVTGMATIITAIEPLKVLVFEAMDIKSRSWQETRDQLDFRGKCDYRFRIDGKDTVWARSGQNVSAGDTLFPDMVRASAVRLIVDDLRLEVRKETKEKLDFAARPSEAGIKVGPDYSTAKNVGPQFSVPILLERRC